MAFFKREPSPVERFETALKLKQAERRKLATRSVAADKLLAEMRAAAEKLAVAGAANAKLERAEAKMRSVDDQARTLRTELSDLDEQIVATERALADARTQRDRELLATQIEALAGTIDRAVPGFGAGAAALVQSISQNPGRVIEGTRFATSVEAVRREVLSAADLLSWELRALAVRTRAGNANRALPAPIETERPQSVEVERHMIYTRNPLLWREGGQGEKGPGLALVGVPGGL